MIPTREQLDKIRDERADAVGVRNWTYDEADEFYREGWNDAIAYVCGDPLESINSSKWSDSERKNVRYVVALAIQRGRDARVTEMLEFVQDYFEHPNLKDTPAGRDSLAAVAALRSFFTAEGKHNG